MRVVAGELGGRRFQAPRASRPTAERVREALFSILGDLSGLRVLDLFAGSGALGIEALSRGAAEAVFVDRAGAACAVVRRNLAALGLGAQIHRREAIGWLAGAAGETPFGLVFCDPPYDSAASLIGPLSERLPALLTESSRIVTESDKRAPLELSLPLLRERTYGDTRIAVYRAG